MNGLIIIDDNKQSISLAYSPMAEAINPYTSILHRVYIPNHWPILFACHRSDKAGNFWYLAAHLSLWNTIFWASYPVICNLNCHRWLKPEYNILREFEFHIWLLICIVQLTVTYTNGFLFEDCKIQIIEIKILPFY